MLEITLGQWQKISEICKNGVQILGVVGAVFLYYKWVYERRDRSTHVLFELEDRFANTDVQNGAFQIEDNHAYKGIRQELIQASLPQDEVGGVDPAAHGGATSEPTLKSVDALLRFYILLLGIREAGQVPDASLAACYRYWLAQAFNPRRREYRMYIAKNFPTLHNWLSKDRKGRRGKTRKKTFFGPERFGWHPGDRFTAEHLRRCESPKLLVITGAGISAGSGIPTYRGSGGLWRKYRAQTLATRRAFEKDPTLVWEWYNERRANVRQAQPNMAHRLLVTLAQHAGEFMLLTQNVDDLHEKAGTKPEHLLHIHGEILRNRCSAEGCSYVSSDEVRVDNLQCPREGCTGKIRPGVVWFDEDYEPGQQERVEAFLETGPCDLVVVIGTSAGFADIIEWAVRAPGDKGCLVEINTEETCLSAAVDGVLRESAETGLSNLLRMMGIQG
jgi:NAD-dependent deacetylase